MKAPPKPKAEIVKKPVCFLQKTLEQHKAQALVSPDWCVAPNAVKGSFAFDSKEVLLLNSVAPTTRELAGWPIKHKTIGDERRAFWAGRGVDVSAYLLW